MVTEGSTCSHVAGMKRATVCISGGYTLPSLFWFSENLETSNAFQTSILLAISYLDRHFSLRLSYSRLERQEINLLRLSIMT